jgi:hypothetical protein
MSTALILQNEPESDLWSQQIGESGKAFRAFVAYREMAPHERSLRTSYRQTTGRQQAKDASGQWRTWYERWNWKARVLAYDREQDRVYQAERHHQRKEMRDRKARTGRLSQGKALQVINEFNQTAQLSPELAVKLLELGFKLEAEALGDSLDVPEGITVAGQEAESYLDRLRRLRAEREGNEVNERPDLQQHGRRDA